MSDDNRPVVLVAEDNSSNFMLINAVIGKKCNLIWAQNGLEAIEKWKADRDRICMILMDIKMPMMDGLEATKALRAEGATVPVIAQTAHAFATDRDEALAAGATDVLVKPIPPATLRSCVAKYAPGFEG